MMDQQRAINMQNNMLRQGVGITQPFNPNGNMNSPYAYGEPIAPVYGQPIATGGSYYRPGVDVTINDNGYYPNNMMIMTDT
jgi:hypothetical protein